MKTPGGEVLAQIVTGTGCSGTWLLTGAGPMYDSTTRENPAASVRQAFQTISGLTHDSALEEAVQQAPEIGLELIRSGLRLLEHEKKQSRAPTPAKGRNSRRKT